MIVWRAIQGFIGGGMVPTVFASAYTIFPRSRMPMITPMIGLVATLAPTIGPTVGGYLTDALSWHWLFFINIVPGIIVTIAAITLIDFDQPNLSLFESFDWLGLISMALFLGALEYVLEDGPRYDWFEDPTIALRGGRFGELGGNLLHPRPHGAATRSWICAPFSTAISRWQHVFLRARHRPLRPDLSLSDLSSARSAATTR